MTGPVAEILTVGTEILLGEIVDTNARHIGRRLREMGIDVYRTATVGDNRLRIAAAIETSASRSDVCLITGGLGPTADDVTRESAADAAGAELEFQSDQWDAILARFRDFGREPEENNRRQACMPATAEAIPNPVGTAPGFCLTIPRRPNSRDDSLSTTRRKPVDDGSAPSRDASSRANSSDPGASPRSAPGPPLRRECLVVCLPGVPREMEAMLEESVLPALARRFPRAKPIQVRLVRTIGMPESDIDAQLDDLTSGANPTVGLAARAGTVDVRIAAKAGSAEAAQDLIGPVEAEVRRRLGDAVFGIDSDRPGAVARRRLSERGWQLAAAEIGLRGALARVLTEGSDAAESVACVEVYGPLSEQSPDHGPSSNQLAADAQTWDTLAKRHGANVTLIAQVVSGWDRRSGELQAGTQSRDRGNGDSGAPVSPSADSAGADELPAWQGRIRLSGPGFNLDEIHPLGPNLDYGRDRLANLALGLLLRQLGPAPTP